MPARCSTCHAPVQRCSCTWPSFGTRHWLATSCCEPAYTRVTHTHTGHTHTHKQMAVSVPARRSTLLHTRLKHHSHAWFDTNSLCEAVQPTQCPPRQAGQTYSGRLQAAHVPCRKRCIALAEDFCQILASLRMLGTHTHSHSSGVLAGHAIMLKGLHATQHTISQHEAHVPARTQLCCALMCS